MTTISRIGLDIAKSVFEVHAVNAQEQVVVRRSLRRGPQESPHFDRHITAAWLAVTLWGAPCCSSRGASLPRAIRSTCPDRRRRAATGAAFYSTALKS